MTESKRMPGFTSGFAVLSPRPFRAAERLGEASPSAAPSTIQHVIRSKGEGLEAPVRKTFERRLGHDFSNVRVHSGPAADRSARSMGALAYTVGRHVVLTAGHRPVATGADGRLLAHELSHVVQSAGRAVPMQPRVAPIDHPAERAVARGAPGDSVGEAMVYRAIRLCEEYRQPNTGTGNPGPGIRVNVNRSAKQVAASATLEVHGADADAAKASTIQSTLNSTWTKSFPDGTTMAMTARVSNRPATRNAAGNATQIELMRSGHGESSAVMRHWLVGSRYMSLDLDDARALDWTVAHEFGHLMGLDDHYSEDFLSQLSRAFGGESSGTTPDSGYETNIMGTHGGNVEPVNVQTLIERNSPMECIRWRTEMPM